jgi:hypothetical protein
MLNFVFIKGESADLVPSAPFQHVSAFSVHDTSTFPLGVDNYSAQKIYHKLGIILDSCVDMDQFLINLYHTTVKSLTH